MIIWQRVNGILTYNGKTSFRTNDWIGEPQSEDYHTGICLEYTSEEPSNVFVLDGQLPNGIRSYSDPNNNKIYLHGIISSSDLYKTFKFVIRAEAQEHKEEILDDTYCELIVDNTINENGEKIAWATTQIDLIDDGVAEKSSLEQISYRFKLNSDVGNQYFYKSEGDLPDGLVLEPNGTLVGTLSRSDETKDYSFRITAEVSGYIEDNIETITLESEEFHIRVNPVQENMKNPIFLNTNTSLGNVDYNTSIVINVKAWIRPSRVITYTIVEGQLPNGLELSAYSGVISGTCVETQEKVFSFKLKAECASDSSTDYEGGYAIKEYEISTNHQLYDKDIIIPDKNDSSASDLGTFKIGEYFYQEIIVENKNYFYTFDTRKVCEVLPKGLSLAYERRRISETRLQTVCIISGVIEPQPEKIVSLNFAWFRNTRYDEATYRMQIVVGKDSDLKRLYIGLPHQFLDDWMRQFNFFSELSELTKKEKENPEYVEKILSNIVSETTSYNGSTDYIKRQFEKLVLNNNNEIYGIKYFPRIYLSRAFKEKEGYEDIENYLGKYDEPLTFALSNIKYTPYVVKENGVEVIKYYVLYRDIIDYGFGEATRSFKKLVDGELVEGDKKSYYSPTIEGLKEKIDAINGYENISNGKLINEDILEWEDKWSPKVIIMYIRPDALSFILPLLNQMNEAFIEKTYVCQYICSESYFTNIVSEKAYWFFTYYANYQIGLTKNWRDKAYDGDTPVQPALERPDLPSLTNYSIITEKKTPDCPRYALIVDDETKEIHMTIHQTVGFNLYNLVVDYILFDNRFDEGTYVFKFNGEYWTYEGEVIDIASIGISFSGIVREGNELTVEFTYNEVGGYHLATDVQLIIEDL